MKKRTVDQGQGLLPSCGRSRHHSEKWDEPLTARAGIDLYGGDLDGISEKLPYLKSFRRDGAVPGTRCLKRQACTNTIRRTTATLTSSLAVTKRCCGCGTTRKRGYAPDPDGVFNHSGDSHAWFDRHISRWAAHAIIRTHRSVTGTVLTRMAAPGLAGATEPAEARFPVAIAGE